MLRRESFLKRERFLTRARQPAARRRDPRAARPGRICPSLVNSGRSCRQTRGNDSPNFFLILRVMVEPTSDSIAYCNW